MSQPAVLIEFTIQTSFFCLVTKLKQKQFAQVRGRVLDASGYYNGLCFVPSVLKDLFFHLCW